jgi:hypothetical protein
VRRRFSVLAGGPSDAISSHSCSVFGAIRRRYLRGVGAIMPGLLNCFLTCVAGAFANVAYEHWNHSAWDLLARRILVGYLGAVCIVILVLPWLHQISIERRVQLQQD